MAFFEIISIFALSLSIASAFIAVQALRANMRQAQQVQMLYQALAALQVYFFEEEEWQEYSEEPDHIPSTTNHRVIDLLTRRGMTYSPETDTWEPDA